DETKTALAPWLDKLGAWKSSTVLGNESYGGHPYTYARLTFEKGTTLAELGWSGMGVEPVRFVPQADGSFASYDVRTGTSVRLSFEGTELVAKTAEGVVKARRVD